MLGGMDANTVKLSPCNRIRRAATHCRRGKNKLIVGMGMPNLLLFNSTELGMDARVATASIRRGEPFTGQRVRQAPTLAVRWVLSLEQERALVRQASGVRRFLLPGRQPAQARRIRPR
jgi:hypothetical protein